ncbi:MAG: hypothetical protein ACNA7T_13960 [Haliea sp.]
MTTVGTQNLSSQPKGLFSSVIAIAGELHECLDTEPSEALSHVVVKPTVKPAGDACRA